MKNKLQAWVMLVVIRWAARIYGIRVVRVNTFRVVRQAMRERLGDGEALCDALTRARDSGCEHVVVTVVHGHFAVLPAIPASAHS